MGEIEGKIILLVEDNPDDIELISRSFEKNHIVNKVIVTRDGADALDYLFCKGQYAGREALNPVLILLDLRLPKIDGIEVLRQIRSHESTKAIPVVVLTSSQEEGYKSASYQLLANGYVRKPVELHQFMEVVRQIGLFWLVLNEPPSAKALIKSALKE
jgi:two-component system response regulator